MFDLCYRLERNSQHHAGFGKETDWTKEQVADLQSRDQELDEMRKVIRYMIDKRDALKFCQRFLTCVLKTRPNRLTTVLDNLPDVAFLPQSRTDRDREHEAKGLPARLLAEARDRLLIHIQVRMLKELSDDVRMIQQAGAFRYEGPRLLYRVHRPGSHTFFDEDVGFCCPRWIRERNFMKPSKQDFYRHVNGEQASSEGTFETPYISMTGSPLRVLKLVQPDEMLSSHVSVISGEHLWAMNIHFERTTAIADQNDIIYTGPRGYDRAHYITETHWVARYWIPADCIMMRMPFLQFKEVCKRKRISGGTACPAH